MTNGTIYRSHTDLEAPNKMDERPFFEVDMWNLKDSHIEKLRHLCHDQYNTAIVLNSANEMKYINAIRSYIVRQTLNPSDEFVNFFTKQVFDGMVTKNVIENFRPMVQRAFQQYTNDAVN